MEHKRMLIFKRMLFIEWCMLPNRNIPWKRNQAIRKIAEECPEKHLDFLTERCVSCEKYIFRLKLEHKILLDEIQLDKDDVLCPVCLVLDVNLPKQ